MIDFHTHPMLVQEMADRYPELLAIARDAFFIGNRMQPLETFLLQMDVAGIQRAVLLPIDATTARGCKLYSNEQIAELCTLSDRFIGFASVDPHNPAAPQELEQAINGLGLRGLKLSPPTQEFFPNDRKLAYPIYQAAQALDIPVVVHCGMTWEPRARANWAQPILLEDVAFDFPRLKLVIAHMGWPWVLESVTLALKYPNVTLDTSALYFDNPWDFVAFVMTRQVPLSVFERSLRHQVVFGSNYPRVEIKNMVRAVRRLGLSEGCLDLIFRENAAKLLGE
jgi:predicted TIM-barrel fold metal-dependent hydrolase